MCQDRRRPETLKSTVALSEAGHRIADAVKDLKNQIESKPLTRAKWAQVMELFVEDARTEPLWTDLEQCFTTIKTDKNTDGREVWSEAFTVQEDSREDVQLRALLGVLAVADGHVRERVWNIVKEPYWGHHTPETEAMRVVVRILLTRMPRSMLVRPRDWVLGCAYEFRTQRRVVMLGCACGICMCS